MKIKRKIKDRQKGKSRVFLSIVATIVIAAMTFMMAACSAPTPSSTASGSGSATPAAATKGTIRLATTTSTKDSGLLDAILPDFTAQTGWDVEVISVGSGEAMKLGENGEADVLLVHSPAAEKTYVENGNADATGRIDVMYNDYVIIGPDSDPAQIQADAGTAAVEAFRYISAQQVPFVSRGDESGTHAKEKSIWTKADIAPAGDWYIVAGAGMGAVITMADEKAAYTLADRATWLSNASKTSLKIVCEKDPSGILNNQYGVICVNPDKNAQINHEGAVAFQEWITSAETQQNLIAKFGIDKYGEGLFTPNAPSTSPSAS